MEVIEIKSGKMIFLLDYEDREKYHLLDSQPSMKEGYLRLIKDIGIDKSFLSDVLVQIFDSKNGGCEMFVTKMQDSSDSDKKRCKSNASYIYSFESFENMLHALNSLHETGQKGVSAYRDERNGRFFLSLNTECNYLSEFMAKRSKHIPPEYLSEHCSLICHDAVGTLSVFT